MKVSTAQDRYIDHSAYFTTIFRVAALLLRLGWRKFVKRKDAGLTVLLGGAGYGVVMYRIFSLPAGALPQGLGWGLLGLFLLYSSWSVLKPSRAEASVSLISASFPLYEETVWIASGLKRSVASLATAAFLIPLAWRAAVLLPFAALAILLTLATFPAAFLHAASDRRRRTGGSPSRRSARPLLFNGGRLIRGSSLPGILYGILSAGILIAILLPGPLAKLLRGRVDMVQGTLLLAEFIFPFISLMDEDAVLRANFARVFPFPWNRWQSLLHLHHFILFLMPRTMGIFALVNLGGHWDWLLRLSLGISIFVPAIGDPPILRGLALMTLGVLSLIVFMGGSFCGLIALVALTATAMAFGRMDWIGSINDSGRYHERLARLP